MHWKLILPKIVLILHLNFWKLTNDDQPSGLWCLRLRSFIDRSTNGNSVALYLSHFIEISSCMRSISRSKPKTIYAIG